MNITQSTTPQPDDIELTAAMAGGDSTALRTFYDRHSGLVLAIANRVLFDRQDSEDLLQDVFLEFWRRASTYDADRGSPRTFLVLLTRSRAIDRLRSRDPRPARPLDPAAARIAAPGPAPAAYVDGVEQRALVRRALGDLSADQREVLEAAFYDGLSHSEIASKLNKPLGSVKTYIRQAIIRLRKTLAPVTSFEPDGADC